MRSTGTPGLQTKEQFLSPKHHSLPVSISGGYTDLKRGQTVALSNKKGWLIGWVTKTGEYHRQDNVSVWDNSRAG